MSENNFYYWHLLLTLNLKVVSTSFSKIMPNVCKRVAVHVNSQNENIAISLKLILYHLTLTINMFETKYHFWLPYSKNNVLQDVEFSFVNWVFANLSFTWKCMHLRPLVCQIQPLLVSILVCLALKVSKFQKQIFLSSFEPKTEWNYFLISVLRIYNRSNQKMKVPIMLNTP